MKTQKTIFVVCILKQGPRGRGDTRLWNYLVMFSFKFLRATELVPTLLKEEKYEKLL